MCFFLPSHTGSAHRVLSRTVNNSSVRIGVDEGRLLSVLGIQVLRQQGDETQSGGEAEDERHILAPSENATPMAELPTIFFAMVAKGGLKSRRLDCYSGKISAPANFLCSRRCMAVAVPNSAMIHGSL